MKEAGRSKTSEKPHRGAPVFVAIVGGTGAGKTWMSERLEQALGAEVARISLDDFYRDRANLPEGRRARINFDHPRAIDWPAVERVISDCAAGRTTSLPRYDFCSHCRRGTRVFRPARIILVEGLWLLLRRSLRHRFACTIFLDCPVQLRLRRRITRDCAERNRSEAEVRRQFRETVSPMHERFVEVQKAKAEFVFPGPPSLQDITRLARHIRELAGSTRGRKDAVSALAGCGRTPAVTAGPLIQHHTM